MDGGSGGSPADEGMDEARRVAFMAGAIAAYRRDKEKAAKVGAAGAGTRAGDPWKDQGRRAQMRSTLR